MRNKIDRVFDYFGPHGPIPNGLNSNYMDSYTKYDFTNQHEVFQDFINKFEQVSVYDCHHNIDPSVLRDITIDDINRENFTIYPITPYGSVMCCLGHDFTFHLNKTVFDFISEKCKKELRENKNFYILFDYSSEGDIRPDVFQALHEGLEKNNIPTSKCIFVCASLNTLDIYKSFLDLNPQKEHISVGTYPWAVMAKGKELYNILNDDDFHFKGSKSSYDKLENINFDSHRKHKFLLLNRRLKPHRIILLSLLENHDLLKDNLVSYDLDMLYCKDANRTFEESLVSDNTHRNTPYIRNREQIKDILKGYKSIKKKKKQIVDAENINSVWGFGFERKQDYQDTYFSVVSETLFYETGTYLSEKVFKPLAHCHPFVLVSRPNSLQYLQNIGFKTFGDVWDESYDKIDDDENRMTKIYQLVKSLSDKSDEEWLDIYKKVKEILIHNRNHLLTFAQNQTDISEQYINNLKTLAYEDIKENYSLL